MYRSCMYSGMFERASALLCGKNAHTELTMAVSINALKKKEATRCVRHRTAPGRVACRRGLSRRRVQRPLRQEMQGMDRIALAQVWIKYSFMSTTFPSLLNTVCKKVVRHSTTRSEWLRLFVLLCCHLFYFCSSMLVLLGANQPNDEQTFFLY